MPLRYDLDSENFSHFFLEQVSKLSEAQKEVLPRELLFKVYKKGYRIDMKSLNKLTFLEKLFILIKALNKRWLLLVEDDLNGMSEEEYFKYKKLTEKRTFTDETAGKLITEGTFVLGASELVAGYGRLNTLSTSPAYNFLSKSRNKNYLKPNEYNRNMEYLNRFISHYEGQRKKIVMETGLTMGEWMILTHLYSGYEMKGSYIYKEKYRYSFNSSAAKLKLCFGSLQRKGFIIKHGLNSGATLQITALGKAKVNDIMSKYVVNC